MPSPARAAVSSLEQAVALSTQEQQLSASQVAAMQAQVDDISARFAAQMPNDAHRPTTVITFPADPWGRSYGVVVRGDQENTSGSDVYTEHDMYATLKRTVTSRNALGLDTPTLALSRADYGVSLFGRSSAERINVSFDPVGPVSASGFYKNIPSASGVLQLNNLSSGTAKDPVCTNGETTTRDVDGDFGGGAYDAGLVTQADVDAMFVLSRLVGGYFVNPNDFSQNISSHITISRGASVSSTDGTEFIIRGYPVDPDTFESGPNSSLGYIEGTAWVHWTSAGVIDKVTMQRTGYTVPSSPNAQIFIHLPPEGSMYDRIAEEKNGTYVPVGNFTNPTDIIRIGNIGDICPSPLIELRSFE